MSIKTELVVTADGSHTLKLIGVEEQYHSLNGAITESMHVFIHAGLDFIHRLNTSEINVLEVGYGTGLNALLSAIWAEKNNVKVCYTALEANPVDRDVMLKLNYPNQIDHDDVKKLWTELLNTEWGKENSLSELFSLKPVLTRLEDFDFADQQFDAVFFDAFSPKVSPEMWKVNIFQKIAKTMNYNSALVTYSTSGNVKRALVESGFEIEKIPGPPGKREMLRAIPLTKEHRKINIRVYGILINKKKILITDEYRLGTYMSKFPGGGIKYGEGTISCLKREIMEELGMEAININHFYTTDFFQETKKLRPGQQLISIYYLFEVNDPNNIPVTNKTYDFEPRDGAQSFRWIEFSQINEEIFTFPIDKKVANMLVDFISL